MPNLKSIALATVALGAIVTVGSASAADLPVRTYTKAPVMVDPAYNWSGFYVGATVGGHWSNESVDPVMTDPTGFFGPPATGAGIIRSFSQTTLHPSGVAGGVEAGYNWQSGQWVVGVEGDVTWLDGTSSRTLTGFPGGTINPADIETNSGSARYLATLRPRVGISFAGNRALAYVTGGVAFARLNTTDAYNAIGGTALGVVNSGFNRTGWTVGGGIEYAVTHNWSVKAEYLYADLGTATTAAQTFPPAVTAGTFINYNHRYTENLARAGVNYKFDWAGPVVAKY
jgi:outer membrane immunogenic protein